ncbi:MAG: putative DNA binding domain-containing protein [Chloroflexi bacterium]|nr:putative DNA binding domain-containing protein [Chloroflexota bacterium]
MPHRVKATQQRQWWRMDLHLHTPASVDYKQPNVTYLDLLKKAEEKNLDIIAFTDHNTVAGYARYLEEVESLELLERLNRLREDERVQLEEFRRLRGHILVLPGFEFTATLGFHILGIFPLETTVRELEHLLLTLRVPAEKLDQGSGEVGATTDALTAYRLISEAGGLVIAAHANSSHGVAMPGFDFGGQTRIAYTQDSSLNALEVTDMESRSRRRTAMFFSGTKPEYPRRMHVIQGSDAHKLTFDPRYKNEMGVGDRATEILLEEVAFEAIKDLFLGNDFSRTRPYRPATEEPYDPVRNAREEGDTLVQAFHERLHDKRAIARPVLEDTVALANTNGGTIYIGASANARTPVVGVERPEQAGSDLRNAISKEIMPPLEVQIDIVKSQGKSILQVIVPRGSEAPYALESTYIYVRSENETGLAVRDEIVQLVRDALAVEFAASAPLPSASSGTIAGEPTAKGTEVESEEAPASQVPPVEPPHTGVEIVSSEMRKGVTYYAVRDLRNSRIVQNVTRASARRLWQYAIEEYEKKSCDSSKLSWVGNISICKKHKRGGKLRYDLAQRIDGRVQVYYGVTEDGIYGPWRELVEAEAGGEPEETAEAAVQGEPDGETANEVAVTAEQVAGTEPPVETEAAAIGFQAVVPEQEANAEQLSEVGEGEPETEQRGPGQAELEAFRPESAEQVPLLAARTEEKAAEAPSATEQPREAPSKGPEALTEERAEAEQPLVARDVTAREMVQAPREAPTKKSEIEQKEEQRTAPEPPQPKSRAQAWREILDRAIAEAKAAQAVAKTRVDTLTSSPQINGEEAALAEDRVTAQAEERTTEIVHSEEQAGEVERAKAEGEELGKGQG